MFSAEIPKEFEAEYILPLKAINIYDKNQPQIYITYFEADRFLTLSTVDITQRDPITIKGHEAFIRNYKEARSS